jgi:ABC-type Zn2+ transport system substrate-binding protein/surface adhesin
LTFSDKKNSYLFFSLFSSNWTYTKRNTHGHGNAVIFDQQQQPHQQQHQHRRRQNYDIWRQPMSTSSAASTAVRAKMSMQNMPSSSSTLVGRIPVVGRTLAVAMKNVQKFGDLLD